MLALLAQFDKTGNRHAGGWKAQQRMLDQRGLERRNGKPQGDAEQAKRDHTQHEALRHDAPAQQRRGRRAEHGRYDGSPQRRLALGGKVKNDGRNRQLWGRRSGNRLDRSAARGRFGPDLRPGITQANGAVEDEPARR